MSEEWLRRFSIFDFPLTGAVADAVGHFAATLPTPWGSHARIAIDWNSLTASKQCIVAALSPSSELAVGVWLSLPDRTVVADIPKPAAYIYHVYVAPEIRRRGLGLAACRTACGVAARAGVNRVMLAAKDERLRSRLYGAIGFEPLKNNRFLMECSLDPAPRRELRSRFQIRPVTPFDLATVQSICAGDHWHGADDRWEAAIAEDIEEDFCSLFSEAGRQSTGSCVATGALGPMRYISWCVQSEPMWQRISFSTQTSTRTDAARAGRLVVAARQLLATGPDSGRSARIVLAGL